MALFLTGLALFLGVHAYAAVFRKQRVGLIQRLGEGGYKGLYSVASLIGLTLIYMGWPQADAALLYTTPASLRHVTFAIMAVAVILFVASLMPAGRIAEITKHPFLLGIKLWAVSHLLINGDVRSVILFGGFLAFAILDRISVKRRQEPVRIGGPFRNDLIAIAVGLLVYGLIAMFLHQYLAGIRLF